MIWHRDETARLCIPDSDNLIGDVLKIVHTEAGHSGAVRTFERAASSWYIGRLARHVRKDIRHCPQCLSFQTRNTPYGSLQPVPFHTITIDYILALPESGEFNTVSR
jgi:hypothetical protein